MSGTSLDGLDIALCRFEGSGRETKIDLVHFETVSYQENFKKQIRYTLYISFVDSNNVFQKKKGIVMFTPDGKTIINSEITDQ